MLWSRINKSRILEIARAIFGPVWASAQSKSKKPALAKAMERAFAAGDPPVGLDAAAHAAALAWIPPGFAAFDRGRMDEEADDAGAAEPMPAADPSGPDAEPAAEPAAEAANADMPADPPRSVAAAGSIDPPAAPETDPAPIDDGNVDDGSVDGGNGAGGDGPAAGTAEPAAAGHRHAAPRTGERPRQRGGFVGNPRVPAPRSLSASPDPSCAPSCAPPGTPPGGALHFLHAPLEVVP